jgi:4-diphosphocytidyl-2-C-methyl-D-erythritol kinase
LKILDNFGKARLTGTGACAFVSFETVTEAERARNELPGEWTSILAKGVNSVPLPVELD